jgi:hypothetical protein
MSLFVQDKVIQGRLFDSSTYNAPRPGDIGLCWRAENPFHDKDVTPPIYIVINDGELLDFFAWVSAYFQSLNPISTYHHVVKHSIFKEIVKKPEKNVPESVWNALSGLSLGETYAMGGGVDSNFMPTAFSVSTSFSYILGKCIAEGFSASIWNIAYKNWLSLRDFFGLSRPIISREKFILCAYIINRLLNDREQIDSEYDIFCKNINRDFFKDSDDSYFLLDKNFIYDLESVLDEGFDTQNGLLQFVKVFNLPIDAYDFFSFPKEERYSSLKPILSKIDIKNFNDEFLYAYLVNLISPGSFSHIDIFAGKYKAALPWYGLCAGLSSRSKIKNSFSFLGKRIYRDMTRKEGVFSYPRCDLSYDELISLYKTKEELFDYVKSQRVTIEIVPNVDIIMSKQSQQDSKLAEHRQLKMVENFLGYLAEESHSLLQILHGAQENPSSTKKRRPQK